MSSSWTFLLLKLTSTQYMKTVYMKTSLQVPGLPSSLSTLNSIKVDEDDIFVRQVILQFLSVESKD